MDILSRKVNQTVKVKRDNKNQVMLKKKWLKIKVIEKKQFLIKKAEEQKIKKLEIKDNKIVMQQKK